jgi:anti-sigma factor RsiW
MNQDLLTLLYRSLDEDLAPAERKALEEALAASQDLRLERERLLAVRAAVSGSAADSFKPFFAERVMRRLSGDRLAAGAGQFWPGWRPVFTRVALAGVVTAVALVLVNLAQTDRVSVTAALGLPEVSLDQMAKPPVESMLEELS